MTWQTVKLGDFLKVRQERFKPKDKAIEGLKRVNKIDFSGNIYLSNKDSNTDMILVKQGDLLISGINVEKGAVAVYDGQEDVTATIHYSSYEFDNEKIDVNFLKLFLKSPEFLHAIKEQVPGGIKTEIKPKHLLPLEVTIPELDEQKKVVENFSSFNSKQNLISTELNRQLALVKELRQAYLREAMQGKLVPQDERDEPANVLLAKIKSEKEKLAAEKRIKRDKPLPPIGAEENPFELPSSWTWCRLIEISELKSGNQYKYTLSENGVMYVRVGDMNLEGNEYEIRTSSNYFDQHGVKERDLIPVRSIIFPKRGGAIATNKRRVVAKEPILVDSNTMAVIPDQNISFDYFLHWFNTIDLSQTGNVNIIPQVNNKDLEPLIIPLPPLAEQERIVAKLEKLMKFCDELEANIRHGQQQTESLLQVSLKEALTA